MALFGAAKNRKIKRAKRLVGSLQVPGDKSISHRYALLGAIAEGPTKLRHFSSSADCQSTVACLRSLGVRIESKDDSVTIHGVGAQGLRQPAGELDAGNSGSTMRMLAGILASEPFRSVLTGDSSLVRRPMRRVIDPLIRMGARITSAEGGLPPLQIEGGPLRGIRYELPIPSAQVKSAVLLAGVSADGETEVVEPVATRDHTEIALERMGARIGRHRRTISVHGGANLRGTTAQIPGDISSAAFFLIAALLLPESNLVLANVGLNPTRTAILDVLAPMGADVRVLNVQMIDGELVGDLHVEGSELEGGEIPLALVPRLIDELPALAVLGTQAERGLVFRGAGELRVKESDRLRAVAEGLRSMGAEVEEFPDGLRVAGRQRLRGVEIESFGDHRIAMAFAVAGLVAEGTTVIRESRSVDVSFPGFFTALEQLVER